MSDETLVSSYIWHTQRPYLVRPPDSPDDPRVEINRLLEAGKAEDVIRLHDPLGHGEPEDRRLYLSLVVTHLQAGNVPRARDLCEQAIRYFQAAGDRAKEANGYAQLARIEWREKSSSGGFSAAMSSIEKALALDPQCRPAWINGLCYCSLDENTASLESFVARFVDTFPEFDSDDLLASYLREDAQLAWARSQPCFAKIVGRIFSNTKGEPR